MSASQLRITLAGSEHVVEAGTTAGEALMSPNGAAVSAAAGPDTAGGQVNAGPATGGGAGAVIAARVNGDLRDLACRLAAGDVVEPVPIGSPEGRSILRHSTAHVLAQAVQQLFPDAKLGIGPPIENGFYYDFDVAEPFTPDDLRPSSSGCGRSSSRASDSSGASSVPTRRAPNWPSSRTSSS